LAGGIELTSEQIKTAVVGFTFSGTEVSEGFPVRVFFGKDQKFSMVATKPQAASRSIAGNWFVESEANLLCMRASAGNDGRACWRLIRGAELEFIYVKGSASALNIPAVALRFSQQESGEKLAAR
jgi:hypothetical protein